jgi:two-component system OmpR family response regulator
MSGYAVCERIRSQRRDVPILILSARTLSEDRTRGFDVGADQYMMKPFDLDELISRVKNLLVAYRHRADQQPATKLAVKRFEIGDAAIDFERFEVQVDGKTTRLTQQEVKLLQYFIEHDGRVIPRAELLEKVWELPSTINTRAPDQFLRRLRKLFEPEPAHPRYFLTIRDVGYRFVSRGE